MAVHVRSRNLLGAMGLVLAPALCAGGGAVEAPAARARAILAATGVKGGLVVHLGCGDGRLTAALRASDSYLVHGLDTDAANVAKARKHVQASGLYGTVSVELWAGRRLPYADNLVNLLVSDDLGGVPMAEVMRVLVPRGVAYTRRGGSWTKTTKPWPREIDEWTHYLHDASGNAVARDTRVGPPQRMQWVGKPLHGRSHEIDTSVCALVSARGRIFYILDEGLTGITDERLPQTWAVVARDAFNGVLLWKRPLPHWGWPEWKLSALKGKDWTTLRGQRTRSPASLPRRLVAVGDRVYVTLGYSAPLSVLDAATGELVRTCEGTEGTDEILCCDGTLVLTVRGAQTDAARRRTGKPVPDAIVAVQAATGKVLWRKPTARIVPLCLAAADGRVVLHRGKELVCLSLTTGEEAWRTPLKPPKPPKQGKRRRGGGKTLVVRDGVVLFLEPAALHALAADTGKTLWTGPTARGPGVANPPDLFVADGLVWHGADKRGRDLRTGEVTRTLDLQKVITQGHHFRCYRSKATERYLLWPKRGVEFLDLRSPNHTRHDWLRAPCKYGVMPCNGLLYAPSNQCFCYPGVNLHGFKALAAGSGDAGRGTRDVAAASRLERGPAYSQLPGPGTRGLEPGPWPTFRHDARRTGSTRAAVPGTVGQLWRTKLGGRLTQPVVAGGRLFVASVDAHTVHAVDARSGKAVWSYTAGGRVDSPPTVHGGLVLFGSADGWVYCLRATDGELAWRFRAAPRERRIMAFGQLESAWPVHGSVLVKDGVAYCSAGRSSYLDGGIRLYGLDPKTGRKLHEGRLASPKPDITNDPGRPFDMDGTFSDVLVTDGTYLYMQQMRVDASLADRTTERVTKMGDRKVGRHVFSTAGFLNGAWWNRTFWMYSERWPGFYIANQAPKAGQLLVVDDTTTYAIKCYTRRNRHSPMFFPGTTGYMLFADDNTNEPFLRDSDTAPKPLKWLPTVAPVVRHPLDMVAVNRDKGTGFSRARPAKWATWVPVRARAMVVAGGTLFIAGPPDVLEPKDPLAAFRGRKGAVLWAVSAANGKKLGELKLDSPPVFDGLIAAGGRLYLSTIDGHLLCMGDKP